MKQLIRRILREELSNKQQMLTDLIKTSGFNVASKMVGGIDNVINILYGGDFETYVKDNDIKLVRFSSDGLNMYLHPLMVELIGMPDKRFLGSDMKQLGKFSYGPKDGLKYSFTADLVPYKQNDEIVGYRVVGTSGDSGFGYGFITKQNTLGKRYRQQIFKQIIDKFGLEKYL